MAEAAAGKKEEVVERPPPVSPHTLLTLPTLAADTDCLQVDHLSKKKYFPRKLLTLIEKDSAHLHFQL